MTEPRNSESPKKGNPGVGEPERGGTARVQAGDPASSVHPPGHGLFDRQKRAAADELSSVAGIIREAAGRFEETDEAAFAEYVRKAADAADRISSSLRERRMDELLRETEGALQDRPATFLGLAAAAGFVLGRFLRAGSQRIANDLHVGHGSEDGNSPESRAEGIDHGTN